MQMVGKSATVGARVTRSMSAPRKAPIVISDSEEHHARLRLSYPAPSRGRRRSSARRHQDSDKDVNEDEAAGDQEAEVMRAVLFVFVFNVLARDNVLTFMCCAVTATKTHPQQQ